MKPARPEMQEIEEYSASLKTLPLGELVDRLLLLRIGGGQGAPDSGSDDLTEKAKHCLKVAAVKAEITRREVIPQTDLVGTPKTGLARAKSSGGVTSLGGLF